MANQIPEQMQAIQLDRFIPDAHEAIRNLRIVTRPVPQPQKGEVLVKIEAAPCNPSDLMHLRGLYGFERTPPSTPGWEGAGTVVASGGGMMAKLLVGRRVACAYKSARHGTWAQYCLTDALLCAPLQRRLSTENGAMLFVNPATAYSLLAKARQEGHRAAVQTAAASQLGRMLIRLAAREKFPLVNIVRRTEQVELLKEMGAEIVLNSSSDEFEEVLARECSRLKATIAFEPVAGDMTGRILAALPPDSVVVVYGALSSEACSSINPHDLIFKNKRVEGFWLKNWIMQKSLAGKMRLLNRVQKLVAAGVLESSVRKRVKLSEVVDGLLEYQKDMTEGKVLICPHGTA